MRWVAEKGRLQLAHPRVVRKGLDVLVAVRPVAPQLLLLRGNHLLRGAAAEIWVVG